MKILCFLLRLSWLLAVLCTPLRAAAGTGEKPPPHAGVLEARIVSLNLKKGTAVFQTSRYRWKASVHETTVKQGQRVPLSAFKVGETVVILSVYEHFELIDVLTDRLSYAAFFHDEHLSGKLTQWDPTHDKLILNAARNPLTHIPPNPTLVNKISPENFITYSSENFFFTKQTQFWLGGKQVTREEAGKMFKLGTILEIAFRRANYKTVTNIPAYAVFDRQSWAAYAKSELHTAKDMFQPTNAYPQMKD